MTQLSPRQNFLLNLVRGADLLKEDASHRRPYWSQRNSGAKVLPARQRATAQDFVALIDELDGKGYFEKRFGKDCVDDPRGNVPSRAFERAIGLADAWPLTATTLSNELDMFCDVVEVLHDLAARPTNRTYHSYSQCGWHHSDFSIESGREIYRWRVNALLRQSNLDLILADGGEDVGRLVTVTTDARSELVEALVSNDSTDPGDQVRHAVALFRARGADRHQKRSAVVVLARVLESRRDLLRNELLSKDEDALFLIANKFDIRHQNQAQRSDYDDAFMDWVFWWYLATIELVERLSCRDRAT